MFFNIILYVYMYMYLGLGPRKFKTKYTEVGDRSVWTRMPGEMPPKVCWNPHVQQYSIYVHVG